MTSVVIVNKCKLTPCSLQIFQGGYESSESINTVQFFLLEREYCPRKKKIICWVTLVVLLSSTGKWEMKCVICALTVFELVLRFENLDLLSGACRACRLTRSALDSRFSAISCAGPTWGAAPAPGQGSSACTGHRSHMCPYVLLYVLHTINSFGLEPESRIWMHESILGCSLPSGSSFSQWSNASCLATLFQDQRFVCGRIFRLRMSLLFFWVIFPPFFLIYALWEGPLYCIFAL